MIITDICDNRVSDRSLHYVGTNYDLMVFNLCRHVLCSTYYPIRASSIKIFCTNLPENNNNTIQYLYKQKVDRYNALQSTQPFSQD